MAPRGIVAGATASGFGLQLAAAGVQGADKILPIVYVVIFGTVGAYGLTGLPVARRLGVAGSAGTLVLIVGGHEAARALATAFKRAGVGVRLWAEPAAHDAARSGRPRGGPRPAAARLPESGDRARGGHGWP